VTARNWRPPQGGGELDLVAWKGEVVVFVEVKARQEGAGSAPERNIDPEKERVLRRAARDYLRRAGVAAENSRFDVITVEGTTVAHLPDAFPVSVLFNDKPRW
jgi:putative endonuclease